ncbi:MULTISPECIES: hypothetical protein [unclassified Endozoicomonas]|uniref:hypothetical protein n=1 Tax=unclassified Endozoicomonas TaxID=2644528 RepID=UPI0021484FA0|nr:MULTISPECIES: hypothetical protein [unclassified Endozoicomonas]
MNNSFNLCPLLLCLLYSMAQASPPSKKDFDFLEPLNDSVLVANGLELTESLAGVSLSTLLNLGVWWGICKTAGIVSGLSSTYDLAASDTKELEPLKTDFCSQLAPVITTAEVALAGHVSPWPLEQRWWRPLYFAGAGMAANAASTIKREHMPVVVMIYLASEALTRTGASAISALILRKMSTRDIATEWYLAGEYEIFSMMNGIVAGAVAYEAMIHKGYRPAKATLASVVSAVIVGTLSGIISVLTIDVDRQTKTEVIAGAGVGAVIFVGAGAGVGAGATAVASVGAAGALVGALAGAGIGFGIGAVAEAGTMILGGVGALLMLGSLKITSNDPFIKAGVTLMPALTFAVVNGLSGYVVYGYSLEQGLSETGWTQWKKFYAPLDYLSTLFN